MAADSSIAAPQPLGSTLWTLLTEDLPEDVREAECTVSALFRASRVLNVLTGGEAEMTFSARCWRAKSSSRTVLARGSWTVIVAAIDVACAVLRGEERHCATAWDNHRSRRRV